MPDVDAAVAAAQAAVAAKQWTTSSGAYRARFLRAIASKVTERKAELAVTETIDNGKPIAESGAQSSLGRYGIYSCVRPQRTLGLCTRLPGLLAPPAGSPPARDTAALLPPCCCPALPCRVGHGRRGSLLRLLC